MVIGLKDHYNFYILAILYNNKNKYDRTLNYL